MLDIKFVRANPEAVKENIRKKFQDEKLPLVDEVIEKDQQYRDAKTRGDYLRGQRNTISKQIGGLMAKGQKEEAEEGAPQVMDVEVQTYRDIPGEGEFLASDQEGGELTFQLVREPKKGTVEIEGGGFVYTPNEGVTGKDSFAYTATDSEGHVSLPGKVTVKIEKTERPERIWIESEQFQPFMPTLSGEPVTEEVF